MTNTSDDSLLKARIERISDDSFFVLLYDFCYFYKKFSKNSKNLPTNQDRG